MSIKSLIDQRFLIFLGLNTQDDGKIIVTGDKSMKDEAEAFLSLLDIYLEQVFNTIDWVAFSDKYRVIMADFSTVP